MIELRWLQQDAIAGWEFANVGTLQYRTWKVHFAEFGVTDWQDVPKVRE